MVITEMNGQITVFDLSDIFSEYHEQNGLIIDLYESLYDFKIQSKLIYLDAMIQ